jgi:hypothetical protein
MRPAQRRGEGKARRAGTGTIPYSTTALTIAK